MRRRKGGPQQAGFKQKEPEQSPEDADLVRRANEARAVLRDQLGPKVPGLVVGLSLGARGYTLLAFMPAGVAGVKLPVEVGGFPVEKRAFPVALGQ